MSLKRMKPGFAALALLATSACTSLGGFNLTPGRDNLADVQRVMGEPALRWQEADGSLQLSYPPRSAGPQSYMVKIGADGKLKSLYNALDPQNLALIQPGMTKEQVLRILGPSDPALTIHFERRNELAWDWVFQDGGEPAHFIVLFDATQGTVRTTMIAPFRVILDFQ